MPASAFSPDVVVELGLGSGFSTPLASVSWTDVSAYVEAQLGVRITRGRSDEMSDVSPSQLTLTLDNRDGRFTPSHAAGAYYPNVKLGTPIRVTATWSAVTYRRFTGYVSEWPVAWPQTTSGSSHATVTASSRQARLGRSTFRNVIAEEILADSPTGYWQLAEPAGSASAADSSGKGGPTLGLSGNGPAVVFGSATGPATDGQTAASFEHGGEWLGGDNGSPVQTSGNGTRVLEAWVSGISPGSGGVSSVYVVEVRGDGGDESHIRIGTIGQVIAGWTAPGGLVGEDGSAATVDDNLTHHILYRETISGTTWTRKGWIDGVVFANTSSVIADVFADRSVVRVGRNFPGAIAHVAVYDTDVADARVAEHYASGSTGFAGESTDARIERLARWAGVPAADVSTEAGNTESMEFVDTAGQSPAAAMLDVARTENGIVFDGGEGILYFQSRGHRYNAAIATTLDAATQQVESDLRPKLDDFGLANDVVAQSSTASVRVVDQASADDRGVYARTVDVHTTSDLEVADAANYYVNAYADPLVRISDVAVQLIVQTSATVASVLALELGDALTLANLPTQAPASSLDYFLEGYTEVIGSEGQGWVWSANLSPILDAQTVWTLGDPVYGALDGPGGLAY